MQASRSKLLKKDVFGRIEQVETGTADIVRRDVSAARFPFAWMARRLLAREARALGVLEGMAGIPALLRLEHGLLEREYLDGEPMHIARPADPDYFIAAARLVRRMHRAGIAHNDLAKEPNFLCRPDGNPAIVDFQLSSWSPRRGPLFRLLAGEDIRHLLKHKRTYCPGHLTAREKHLLDNPSWLSRLWMSTGKPVYLFITRRLMGWQDREGAGDRV